MFKGQVDFVARITARHVAFPRVTAKCPRPTVDAIEVESTHPKATEIRGTVYISRVASEAVGMEAAIQAIEDALCRLVYHHGTSIDPARLTTSRFEPIAPPPRSGLNIMPATAHLTIEQGELHAIVGVEPDTVRATLELPESPGERHFWLYRSARASTSSVEEFIHLYSILLLLLGDSQVRVDAFISQCEPGVAKSLSPKDGKTMETVYTRLRNEVGHVRPGTTPHGTRAEIVAKLEMLRQIVRSAIAANP